MTDQKINRWISTDRKKDSVFIFDDLIYYGRIRKLTSGDIIDQQEIIGELESIPLSYLKTIQINHQNKVTTLFYGKDSDLTVLIKWDNTNSMNEFTKFLTTHFPQSQRIRKDEAKYSLAKSRISALIIIPLIYLVILAIGPHTTSHSSSRISDQFIELLHAVASLGIFWLTCIFGTLFCIALIALYKAKKKSTKMTLIKLKYTYNWSIQQTSRRTFKICTFRRDR